MPFEEPGIQAITLLLISVAALLGLASVLVGLFCTLTGRDALPRRLREMMRRVPASADDFRLRGTILMINGAGVLLIVSSLAANLLAPLAILPPGIGWYTSESLALPKAAMFAVTALVAVSAVALFVAAYSLSLRVGFVSTARHGAAELGLPPQ